MKKASKTVKINDLKGSTSINVLLLNHGKHKFVLTPVENIINKADLLNFLGSDML